MLWINRYFFLLNRYNCSSSANTNEIGGLQFGKHDSVIFAYALTAENHSDVKNKQKYEGEVRLPIFDRNGEILQHVSFKAAVSNVINNIEKEKSKDDDVYFLLGNGDVVRSKYNTLLHKSNNGDESACSNHNMLETVFVSSDDKKVTRFDAFNNKMCFVFNERSVEVHTHQRQEECESLRTDSS